MFGSESFKELCLRYGRERMQFFMWNMSICYLCPILIKIWSISKNCSEILIFRFQCKSVLWLQTDRLGAPRGDESLKSSVYAVCLHVQCRLNGDVLNSLHPTERVNSISETRIFCSAYRYICNEIVPAWSVAFNSIRKNYWRPFPLCVRRHIQVKFCFRESWAQILIYLSLICTAIQM
jgi:hypothetical protein